MHLTGYSDCPTGFCEPLSPPYKMDTGLKKCLAWSLIVQWYILIFFFKELRNTAAHLCRVSWGRRCISGQGAGCAGAELPLSRQRSAENLWCLLVPGPSQRHCPVQLACQVRHQYQRSQPFDRPLQQHPGPCLHVCKYRPQIWQCVTLTINIHSPLTINLTTCRPLCTCL